MMKGKTLISVILCSTLAIAAPFVFADAPKTQPGEMLKVLNDLKSKGFTIVKKIEFNVENGAFEAKVVNAEGKNISIQINAQSGEMTKLVSDIEGLTALDIAKKVSDAGYSNIFEINTELFGNEYEVMAMDSKGQKIKLKVDVKSGKISKTSDLL